MIVWGTRVKFKPEMAEKMGPFGNKEGTVTGPPIGSTREPPGGMWVLWDGLWEPAPCFEEELVVVRGSKK